jgi:hypothetical protein
LRLVEAQHTTELTERVRYSHPPGQLPGQLQLPGTGSDTDEQTGSQDNGSDENGEVSA